MKYSLAGRTAPGTVLLAAVFSCQMALAEDEDTVATMTAAGEAPAGTKKQMRMSEVVITAAGFEQKLVDAPASISVVNAADLKERPYLTLIDAVRDLEGVDVGEISDKTGQLSISMRGMGSDYTLILINGRRQNNHGDIYPNSFGGNQFNHIPPLDTIERIEGIRGELTDGVFGMEDAATGEAQEHNMFSLFAGDTWQPVELFSITGSLRYDNHDTFGDQFSPRLYGVYTFSPSWTVKGGVSKGLQDTEDDAAL